MVVIGDPEWAVPSNWRKKKVTSLRRCHLLSLPCCRTDRTWIIPNAVIPNKRKIATFLADCDATKAFERKDRTPAQNRRFKGFAYPRR
jgi:hypothetical protein